MTESSKYFDAMLGPNFREGSENEIVLRDIDGTTLQLVIHFCYAGHTKITTDNVEELIDAASRMEFLRLEQDCCDFLIDNLTVENCVDALLIADKYNFSELNQKALQFIRDHFEAVPIADVLEVSHENFDELLKYAHYRIEESIIFDRLVQWVGHNKVERAKYVPALAEHIRLEHISDEVIRHWPESQIMDIWNSRFNFSLFKKKFSRSTKTTIVIVISKCGRCSPTSRADSAVI